MKVLLVHNRYQEQGGEDTIFAFEQDLLTSAGIDVATHMADNHAIVSLADRVKAFRQVAANPAMARTITAQAVTGGFDLVHIHNFFPLISPALHIALHQAGVPVVQTLHNYRLLCANGVFLRDGKICEDCTTKGRHHAILHRCYRGSALGSLAVARMQRASIARPEWVASVARFITLTKFARDKFITHGLPADKISVKPNSVADPGIGVAPPAQRQGVLFVGRISQEKGVQLLLDAWARGGFGARERLSIIGDGPQLPQMRQMAPADVHFAGLLPREQVLAHMQQARLLVMPSTWYEGFPATLVEAFACGLPVIAPRLGGFPEMVEPGLNGWLFSPGDPASLAATLEQALADDNALRAMAEGARATYDLRYAPARNRDQLLAIYEDVLSMAGQDAAYSAGGSL